MPPSWGGLPRGMAPPLRRMLDRKSIFVARERIRASAWS
jgi:hypothetical protein